MAVSRVPKDSPAFSRKRSGITPHHSDAGSSRTESSPSPEAHSFQQLQESADIAELFASVREAGQRLMRTPSWQHAVDYRESITRLLSQIVATSFSVETHDSDDDSVLRKKRYTAVVQVKEQVDAIVQHFLDAEKDALNILERVREIEGLLVDILS